MRLAWCQGAEDDVLMRRHKKGSLPLFGLIFIALIMIVFISLYHVVPWVKQIFKIKVETNLFFDMNDRTSVMPVLLKTRTGTMQQADTFACIMTGAEDCGEDEVEIEKLVRRMNTKLILYSDTGEAKSYGDKEYGDLIYADVPLPGGANGQIAIMLDSFSDESIEGSEYTQQYGDCRRGEASFIRNYLTTIDFMGRNVMVHRAAAEDFKKVVAEIKSCDEGREYYYWKDDIWKNDLAAGTYACRQNVNDQSQMSMHSFGLAIDINPSKNPNCPKDALCNGKKDKITDIPDCVVQAFKNNNFVWGGDFRSVKDTMHFEWVIPERRGTISGELKEIKVESDSQGDEKGEE